MSTSAVCRSSMLRSISRSVAPINSASIRSFSSQCRQCAPSLRPSSTSTTKLLRTRAVRGDQISFTGRNGFNSTQCRGYKSVEEQKSRQRTGPLSWKAGVLFILSGVGLIFYFRSEKERIERKRIAEATKGVGKPKVGGPFELVDQHGKPFTEQNMRGKFALVYFGFSHCPDICPEELDKMARMIDIVNKEKPNQLRPIFITCDPARDTPAVLDEYLKEFHPDFIGLTGTWEQVKNVCKQYRVYFSTPSNVKPGQDYLVDHSIYFYLMDPEGDFVEALGRQHSPEAGAKIMIDHMGDWTGPLDRS